MAIVEIWSMRVYKPRAYTDDEIFISLYWKQHHCCMVWVKGGIASSVFRQGTEQINILVSQCSMDSFFRHRRGPTVKRPKRSILVFCFFELFFLSRQSLLVTVQ